MLKDLLIREILSLGASETKEDLEAKSMDDLLVLHLSLKNKPVTH